MRANGGMRTDANFSMAGLEYLLLLPEDPASIEKNAEVVCSKRMQIDLL